VSPPAATVSQRRRDSARRVHGRRRAAARRRRLLLWGAGIGALIVLVIVAMPDVRKAYNDLTLPLQYQDIIRQNAAADHLDPALIAAVIDAETKFIPRTSSTGAEGLMQIEPATAQFLARRSGATTFHVSDLGTPAVNIAYGTYYLRFLLNEYGGNVMEAVAAYNGGETNVTRWAAEARADGHVFGLSDIEFPETRAYVEKVFSGQQDYRRTYPTELGYR
jgi:soluble lytic murein transglycosylase